jgi:molybdenum cofactor cytidylyltransferase
MTTSFRVAGLIAAAGKSERMGRPKALLPWGESTFVESLAHAFVDAGLAPVCVSVPDDDVDVTRALHALPVRTFTNPEPQLGLSGSVRAMLNDLRAHGDDVDGLVLTPVDAPVTTSTLVCALVEALRNSPAHDAAVPVVEGKRGHPALFRASCFAALHDAGDAGGPRAVLDALGARVLEVPWGDARVLVDIDTPALLARLVDARRV